MPNSARDPGRPVRWFYLSLAGLFTVPPEGRPDPVAWARGRSDVLVLRRENEVVWRRATDPHCRPAAPVPAQVSRKRRHLALVVNE